MGSWGTPQSIFAIQEYLLLIFIRKFLFENYHLNQFVEYRKIQQQTLLK